MFKTDRGESAIAFLNLPDWWLAGGAVRNTVWRSLFGNECQLVINDFDIAFFDALGARSQELAARATLTAQFPDVVSKREPLRAKQDVTSADSSQADRGNIRIDLGQGNAGS